MQRRAVDVKALEGRAAGTYLKTRRNRPRAEDERDDQLAISRAGHA